MESNLHPLCLVHGSFVLGLAPQVLQEWMRTYNPSNLKGKSSFGQALVELRRIYVDCNSVVNE